MATRTLNKIAFIGLLTAFIPLISWGSAKKFVDSGEYKKPDFEKCVISDYSQMTEDDNINWLWVAEGAQLSTYGVIVSNIDNKSSQSRRSDTDTVKTSLEYAIDDAKMQLKPKKLHADICVYDIQPYSFGKRFIPFTGGYLSQAGVGIEVILRDGDKNIAMFRHFAREGSSIKDAADEVSQDITKYMLKH